MTKDTYIENSLNLKGFFLTALVRMTLVKYTSVLFMEIKRATGQATRRRPEGLTYRCFLSDLTGFASFCRTGPTRRLTAEDTSGDESCQSSEFL